MVKKVFKFKDYNDEDREEVAYFNLEKSELSEWATSVNGGMDKLIQRMISEKDTSKLMDLFKELILKSYGEKSLDGRYFDKEDENGKPLYRKFYRSKAYSILLMDLISDPKVAADFVNSVIPADMAKQINEEIKTKA